MTRRVPQRNPYVPPRMPPPLRAGSVIAIVAPAGPCVQSELFAGLAWLQTRYRLRIDQRILTREGYLAGSDASRASVLDRAMTDPEVEAIYAGRGGYGAMRIIDTLSWEAFVAKPKRFIGFSDLTAFHLVANSHGIVTIHGPNVGGLGNRLVTPAERMSVIANLEGLPLEPWTNLEVLVEGQHARGPVFGGNLALVGAMAAAGRLVVPPGAIIAFEDVTERPYRIDRMLTSLLLGGHLEHASAIVFGDFAECDPGPDGVTVGEVLRERTKALGIPVVTRAPFGHRFPNRAFPLGRVATLRGDRLDWE